MQAMISGVLRGLEFGPPQSYLGAFVLPIVGIPTGDGPDYLTLGEALTTSLLRVTEVDESGSVPELRVHNETARLVLILDGEELLGAKQNRVVNTSILLKEDSITIIPVSCTESGRWNYRSRDFADSEVVMYHKARGLKSRSVSESLRSKRGFASNQGEVWDSVEEMHEELGTESSTGAMRDAYTVRSGRLDQWEEAFPIVPGQLGMAFIANGRVLGLELVSRPTAYRQLHRRLLRSYTLDVDLDIAAESSMDPRAVVEAFLASLDSLEEHGHAAVGHGTDWRYEGTQTCGAVLAHADTCIHAAFFNIPESKRRPSAPVRTDGSGLRRTGTEPEPSVARQIIRPIEQSYWVVPGRLLAGEYPRTLDRDESIMKLRSLIAAGVTTFIDLTEVKDKLAPYADLLNEVSQGSARHHSFPIIDVGIPASHELTREILDLIDSRIAAGEIVYVHCWGGVGRTGTIVGCWLARHGYAGGAALKRLTELWSACPKSRTRVSPETGAQRHYVQTWNG